MQKNASGTCVIRKNEAHSLAICAEALGHIAHVVATEPWILSAQMYNDLFLRHGADGAVAPILCAALASLDRRPWLRLTNRPANASHPTAFIRALNHRARVKALALSQDGRSLATVANGLVHLWDTKTGRFADRLETGGKRVVCIAWCVGKDMLAAGCQDGSVCLWELTSGRIFAELHATEKPIVALAFSPDSLQIACGISSGMYPRNTQMDGLIVWELQTRQRRPLIPNAGEIEALAWSPDGTMLAIVCGSQVRLCDVRNGQALRVIRWGSVSHVGAVAWSPNSGFIASAGFSPIVKVTDIASGKSFSFKGHRDYVEALAWSPDGSILASASRDCTVRFWNLSTRQPDAVLQEHSEQINSLAWSEDGSLLATGSGTEVRIWNPTAVRAGNTGPPMPIVRALTWSADGAFFASGGNLGEVRIWEAASANLVRKINADPHGIDALAWSPGGLLACGGLHGSYVWDEENRRQIRELNFPATLLAWAPDGRLLATANANAVLIWEDTRSITLLENAAQLNAMAWSPDGRTIAVAQEKSIRLWDVLTRRPTGVIDGHPQMVSVLAWSRDSQSLASACSDNTLHVWNVASGSCSRVICNLSGPIAALAWGAGNRFLASGDHRGFVRVWDLVSGACLMTCYCRSPIIALQFCPDGRRLRAADNGVASGNRPVPYDFELRDLPDRSDINLLN